LSFEAIMVLIDACPPFAKCFNSSSRVVLIRGLRLEFRANEWCNHALISLRQAVGKPLASKVTRQCVVINALFPTLRNIAAVKRRRTAMIRQDFSASPGATDTPDYSHNSDRRQKTAKHFLLSEESEEQGEALPFDIPEELLAQLEVASLEKTAPINSCHGSGTLV
jgi:hypothetical protein